MYSINKLAKILRINAKEIKKMNVFMENATGKTNVLDKIVKENEVAVKKILNKLGIKVGNADAIHKLLLENLKDIDKVLFNTLNKPDLGSVGGTTTLIIKAFEATPEDDIGFFLKKEKAREMIKNTPPFNIIKGFGYSDVNELLEKEKLEEIFAALRFIESRDWMNKIFIKEYNKLEAHDFEKRPIDLIVLSEKWLKLAEQFMRKKYHNVSHLKELGIVFIIPIKIDTQGETLRMFSLILHYLYEVAFYSKLIEKYSKENGEFANKLMSLLRGDVLDKPKIPLSNNNKMIWPIVQRYLTKDNEHDERLFMPHINPEAIHWKKAQNVLVDLIKAQSVDISYLRDLDFVGDFFSLNNKQELVSFDLVDNVMSLVDEHKMTKYLYHHQEALWNKIFTEFMGGDKKIEEMIIKNMDKGYIELTA